MSKVTASKLPIRVLLVDNHAVFRHVVRTLLSQHADIEVVGEAANGLQAVERADTLHPHVILMDVSMPKMNGIEATRFITVRYPKVAVIGLSTNAIDYRAAILEAGASTVLMKENVVEELYTVIQDLAA
jgi:DNA-binding NarL/FixJ family response regulator